MEGGSKELHKMERFWRQKQGGAINKRKEEMVSGRVNFPWGKNKRPLLRCLWGMERVPWDRLLHWCLPQIPDGPVKTPFLGEAETVIRSGVKPYLSFGDQAYNVSDSVLDLWFSF